MRERVYGFDLLRGLCALAVAVYHMRMWSGAGESYSWGLFGVYIFFVLSGASMVVAYRARFAAGFSPAEFMFLRFVRLAPLFALVMLLSARTRQEFASGFLNLTFLFGLGNPGATSWVVGGWSLGIEFAFYLMFPVLLALSGTSYRLVIAPCLIIAQTIFVRLTFGIGTSEAAWIGYTQPLSFIAYFYCGCLIGHAVLDGRTSSVSFAPFVVGAAVILFGSGSTPVDTVTGTRGFVLMLASIAVTYFAAGLRMTGPMRTIASVLGDCSYGLYLLHPFAYNLTRRAELGVTLTIVIATTVALLSSWLVLQFFETPIRQRVRRWVDARNGKSPQGATGR